MIPDNIRAHGSKNILFIGDIYYGFYSSHYHKFLKKMGHHVITLCPTGDIKVKGQFDYVKNVRPILEQTGFKPDLIISAESPPLYWVNYQKLRKAVRVPLVFLSFDSALRHKEHAVLGNFFDLLFISQQDYLDYFKKHCQTKTHLLQYGCDPEIHKPLIRPEINEIAFAGSAWCYPPAYQIRIDYLTALQKVCKLEIGEGFWGNKAAELYARSKMIFNLALQNGVNPRIYEALSYGKLLLTNRTNALNGFFADGVHLVFYDNLNHLISLIKYYVKHPDKRLKIAQQGHQKIWLNHTFYHRVDLLMRQIYGNKIYK